MKYYIKYIIEQYSNNPYYKKRYKYLENFSLLIESLIEYEDFILEELETDDEPDSELDNIRNSIKFSMPTILLSNTPIIYAFITKYAPNAIKIGYTTLGPELRVSQWQKIYKDAKLIGYWTSTELSNAALQVFFMDFPVHDRTKQRGYSNLNINDNPIDFKLFKELAKKDGIEDIHVSSEFFMKYKNMDIKDSDEELNTQIIEDIINELKEDIREGRNIGKLFTFNDEVLRQSHGESSTYNNTELQNQAILNAVTAIKNGNTDLLMAAVMRFGKTHTTYEIIKEMNYKFVLVTSAKADTRTAWRNDVNHVNYLDDFVFMEFDGNYNILLSLKSEKTGKFETARYLYNKEVIEDILGVNDNKPKKTLIVYATLQDLSGKYQKIEDNTLDIKDYNTNKQRYIKDKHKFLFEYSDLLDMIVVDETHYGTHSELHGKILGFNKNIDTYTLDEIKSAKKEIEDSKQITNKIRQLNPKVILQCSGTPYYILASGEFGDSVKGKTVISDVSFNDMLLERDKWLDNHPNEDESKSPYFGIPNMHKIGLQLTKKCRIALKKNKDINASLSYLFSNNGNKFNNEDAVVELMQSIFGSNNHKMLGFLDEERIRNGEIFKHIVLCLPHINDCHLLKKLLIDKHIINEQERKIIVAVERRTAKSGNNTNKGLIYDSEAKDNDTLNTELEKLEKDRRKSLTITVNRFLTGVSVPLWDSMFYMKDTKSPQEYDLAIFRICTRCVKAAKSGDETIQVNRKQNVYIIDFKIDRMYNMMVNNAIISCSSNNTLDIDAIKEQILKQLESQPIYAESIYGKGTVNKLHKIEPDELLKKYINYSKDKSVEDIIDSSKFITFLNNKNAENCLKNFNETTLNKSVIILEEGSDEIETDIKSSSSVKAKLNINIQKSDNNISVLVNKFNNMMRLILYCCICLNRCPNDINGFIRQVTRNKESADICKGFNLNINDVKQCLRYFNNAEILTLNMWIYQVSQLMDDKSLKPIDRVNNAINKLSKFDKNEHVTPNNLVCKMLDNLKNTNVKGKTILEVNSKCGEFLIEIYKRYGKNVANNVKIVPSSQMTKNFIRRILNILKLDESNLLDIGNNKGNLSYNIKDFLLTDNKEILSLNNGMKFDIIVANPPFNLDTKMLIKYFEIGNIVLTVLPSAWLLGKKQNKQITKYFDEYGGIIESIDGSDYFDAAIGGTMSINYCDQTTNVHYVLYDGKQYDKCEDISFYSNDNVLVSMCNKIGCKSLKNSVNNYTKLTTKIEPWCGANKYYEANPNNEWFCIKIPRIRGDYNTNTGEKLNLFMTLFSRNYKITDICQYKNIDTTTNQLYIPFDTLKEALNFYNYCQTDFVRICLYFTKVNLNLFGGELCYIPWLDFSNNIFDNEPGKIDEFLFRKYKLTKEEIEHIYEILPNYYNIKRIDLNKY